MPRAARSTPTATAARRASYVSAERSLEHRPRQRRVVFATVDLHDRDPLTVLSLQCGVARDVDHLPLVWIAPLQAPQLGQGSLAQVAVVLGQEGHLHTSYGTQSDDRADRDAAQRQQLLDLQTEQERRLEPHTAERNPRPAVDHQEQTCRQAGRERWSQRRK